MSKISKEDLLGTWKLVEYSISDREDPDRKFYPLGPDAAGFILYTTDGYVSAQLMTPGRPAYQSGRAHTGTAEEMALAAKGYMAYAGRFELDEEAAVVVHHAEVSMNPTWLGQAQVRQLALDGDTLTITAPANNAVLVWKRAAAR